MTGKQSRKVIIPTEFISPKSNSTGEYFYQIAERLLFERNQVRLIVPRSIENRNAINKLRQQFGNSIEVTFITEGSDYKGVNFAKGFSSIKQTIKLYWATKRIARNADIIFFGTNPTFLVLFISLFLSKSKTTKVLLVYDIFPDNLIAVSNNVLHQLIGTWLRPLFKLAYMRIDKTMVIGRCMKECLVRWGLPEKKISIVSNWADESELVPFDNNPESPNIIEFQFLGNIGPLQGLELLLKAIPLVKSHQASFSFYGRGAYTQLLKDFIASNNKLKVEFGGEVPRRKRNETLNRCQVAIVSLDKRVTGLGVPSKSYFSLAVGKPLLVIAGSGAEPVRLTEEYDLGWTYSSNEPKELAELIDTICETWVARPNSSNIRKIFLERFSKSVGTKMLVDEIIGTVKLSTKGDK